MARDQEVFFALNHTYRHIKDWQLVQLQSPGIELRLSGDIEVVLHTNRHTLPDRIAATVAGLLKFSDWVLYRNLHNSA